MSVVVNLRSDSIRWRCNIWTLCWVFVNMRSIDHRVCHKHSCSSANDLRNASKRRPVPLFLEFVDVAEEICDGDTKIKLAAANFPGNHRDYEEDSWQEIILQLCSWIIKHVESIAEEERAYYFIAHVRCQFSIIIAFLDGDALRSHHFIFINNYNKYLN